MNNIYLPIENFNEYDNYYFLDNYTIIAKKNNLCTNYVLNEHYLKIDKDCSNYNLTTLQEINVSSLTNDFLYRLDISHLLILCFFMFFICVYIPYIAFSSLWKKRKF